MEKIESFLYDQKNYKAKVINSIRLTEEQPDEATLNMHTQKGIHGEKGIFIKKIGGILFLIAAIVQTIGIFINMFKGFYRDLFDYRLLFHFFVLIILGSIGAILLKRKNAVTPLAAFRKYWGDCYFCTSDDTTITPSPNVVGIFYPLANVVENLQSFYPVSIELDDEEITNFVGCMSEVIVKHFADFPSPKGNEGLELVYGVTCQNRKDYHCISKINETLMTVNSGMNIFRYYNGKPKESYCIKLNIHMYCIKLGKYWAPVNTVPKFMEFIE